MTLLVTVVAVLLGTGIWLWILRMYDRVEPEGIRYLVQVGLFGGLASVGVAALFNEGFSDMLDISAQVFTDSRGIDAGKLFLLCAFVGLNEEICKAVSTVYVSRSLGDLDEPIDAMIYAMTVGLGFAAIENMFYAIRFGNDVLLIRFLWPVPAHMAYSAIWGYGLAKARFVQPRKSKIWVMGPYVLAAAFVHSVANYLLFQEGPITALISLGVLGVLGYLVHQQLIELEAESPFLKPGECYMCRHLNTPQATHCDNCGEALQQSEIFQTCPCGLTRVPTRMDTCPVCGIDLPTGQKEEA